MIQKTLMLFVLFHAIHTKAQPPVIPKMANTITVTLPHNEDSIFALTGKALLDAGFVLADTDEYFNTIKAIMNDPEGYSYSMEVNVRVKDSSVILTGTASPGVNLFTYNMSKTLMDSKFKLAYAGKGSIVRRGFMMMDKVAKALNGTVSYEKR